MRSFMTVNNVDYELEWSSRMIKTPAKFHDDGKKIIVKLSKILVPSAERARMEIMLLMTASNVYVTDSMKTVLKGKKLDEGGFSKVYECSGGLVMKTGADLSGEMFIHRLLTGSNHVPVLYDTIGSTIIIMERFALNLKHKLKTEPTTDTEKRNIICKIIDCVDYVHSKCVVHCDIKPSNVFMSPYGRVVIGDFGLARTYVSTAKYVSNVKNIRFGTLPYMSRDVHDRVKPTRRADMESLGWVIVEMFGGVLPWRPFTDKNVVSSKKHRVVGNVDAFIAECFPGDYQPPQCLKKYLEITLKMSYNDKPRYKELKNLFAMD